MFCSWIDNYDTTNPEITAVTYPDNNVLFDSRANLNKVAFQDELTYSPGTFGASEVLTVTHSLGYAPNVKVFFEPFAGEVWQMNTGGTGNGFLYNAAQDECQAEIFANTLSITAFKYSNATRRVWYRIYYDTN